MDEHNERRIKMKHKEQPMPGLGKYIKPVAQRTGRNVSRMFRKAKKTEGRSMFRA